MVFFVFGFEIVVCDEWMDCMVDVVGDVEDMIG